MWEYRQAANIGRPRRTTVGALTLSLRGVRCDACQLSSAYRHACPTVKTVWGSSVPSFPSSLFHAHSFTLTLELLLSWSFSQGVPIRQYDNGERFTVNCPNNKRARCSSMHTVQYIPINRVQSTAYTEQRNGHGNCTGTVERQCGDCKERFTFRHVQR
jgi:hypothetical protein